MANLNGGRGWLSDAAAASIHRMDAAYGRLIPINSAGRSYAEQAEAYRKYLNGGPLALRPGTSVHESGNAVDFTNTAWAWLGSGRGLGWNGARANDFGWRRTVSSESWHYEYDAARDKYRGQGAAAGSSSSGGPSIRDVQAWLKENIDSSIVIDGIDGPATQAAVKKYQAILGITQDGVWGAGTEAEHRKWHPANALYGRQWVVAIQDKLNRLGYGPIATDGLDGQGTRDRVLKFQQEHSLIADGIAGPSTNAAMDIALSKPKGDEKIKREQEWLNMARGENLVVDGLPGPATDAAIKRYQTFLGLEADGVWGDGTQAAHAKYYDTWTQNGGSDKIAEDGEFGPASIKALQRKLDIEVDGELGTVTKKALQEALGVTVDGEWGAETYRALQTFLGITVDGEVGPQTWKALQVFLNGTGKFRKVGVIEAPKPSTFPKPEKATYPDAIWWNHSSNSSPRDSKVQYFVIHHVGAAGTTNDGNVTRFMQANDRGVSPNWYIGSGKGEVYEIVPPDNYRAWTTGSFDHKAVTVETRNTSGAPEWGISAESKTSIAKLVAWASKRYGFPIDSTHVLGHKDVPGAYATACPGPSMDVSSIIAEAKKIAAADSSTPTPVPTPEPTPTPTPSDKVTITLTKADAAELKKLLQAFIRLLP